MFRTFATVLCCLTSLLSSTALGEVIDGEEFVDPTRPLMSIAIDNDDDGTVVDTLLSFLPGSYTVSFIRAGSDSAMAVINDRRVSVGDTVGGAEVLSIDRSGVTLLVNDEEQRITLYDQVVRRASSEENEQ